MQEDRQKENGKEKEEREGERERERERERESCDGGKFGNKHLLSSMDGDICVKEIRLKPIAKPGGRHDILFL